MKTEESLSLRVFHRLCQFICIIGQRHTSLWFLHRQTSAPNQPSRSLLKTTARLRFFLFILYVYRNRITNRKLPPYLLISPHPARRYQHRLYSDRPQYGVIVMRVFTLRLCMPSLRDQTNARKRCVSASGRLCRSDVHVSVSWLFHARRIFRVEVVGSGEDEVSCFMVETAVDFGWELRSSIGNWSWNAMVQTGQDATLVCVAKGRRTQSSAFPSTFSFEIC